MLIDKIQMKIEENKAWQSSIYRAFGRLSFVADSPGARYRAAKDGAGDL